MCTVTSVARFCQVPELSSAALRVIDKFSLLAPVIATADIDAATGLECPIENLTEKFSSVKDAPDIWTIFAIGIIKVELPEENVCKWFPE